MAAHTDVAKNVDAATHTLGIDQSHRGGKDVRRLKRSDAPPARGGRRPDTLRKLRMAQRRIVLQLFQDTTINRVQSGQNFHF